jgi:hypothetical protein
MKGIKPEYRAITFLVVIIVVVRLVNYLWPTSEFVIAMDQTIQNW